MTTEHLQWLDLSPPPQPSKKNSQVEATSLCPFCGWPLPVGEIKCPHCGHAPQQEPSAIDLLAELNVTLPETVIEVSPAPERWFQRDFSDDPAFYQLRLQAEQMRVSTGFDRLICLDDISVEHYQHQLEAALRALRDMRGQALLADEVGLGKTIEAGIVMKELIERGLVKTILILTPASLTWQWHEEMESKFHEEFTVLERSKQLPPTEEMGQVERCRWIISLDRAKHPRWAERLLAREYDLLIIDEAHKLKNHRTQAYRFVNQIRKRYVLMLTAAPVHNDLMELYNLITILRPGHLGTRRAFRDNFVARVPIPNPADDEGDTAIPAPAQRRAGRRTIYGEGFNQARYYLEKSRPRREAYRQSETDTNWIIWRTEDFAALDPTKLNRSCKKSLAEVQQLLATGYEIFDFEAVEFKEWGWGKSKINFVCRLKLKPEARQQKKRHRRSTPRRTAPKNPAALRNLLHDTMIRNRRTSVGVRFPPRKAAIYNLNLTPLERELYTKVTAYIRQQLQQAQTDSAGNNRHKAATRLAMMTLQKQLSSSPQAVARTLRKMTDKRPEDVALAELVVLAWGITPGRKVEAVRQILADYPGKFLIFTEYLPTMETLYEALTEDGQEVVQFYGGMSALERAEAVRAFRASARVMISTRSGGEGHNLQFCHQLINFDLPWNPMRIEQRVGRLHRLGQKEAVTIFNLAANDTIEAYILDLLAHKIRMFELVIGELDLILGELADNRSFEQHIEQAWAKSHSEEELLAMIAELEQVLGQSQRSYEEIRGVSDELSDLLEAYDEVGGQ